MYEPNLIEIATNIWNLPNGRSVQLYTKKNPDNIQSIIDHTSFLPSIYKISSRCYCIIHNIHTPPTCKMCTQLVKWGDKSFKTYCSGQCKGSDDDLKTKVKHTVLQRFGVDNPSQSDIIKQKKINTCIINYGVEYPQQNQHVLQKSYDVMMERYGVRRPIQNPEIQNTIKQTMLKKYGVSNPSQSDVFQDKKHQTMISKYGAHSSQQNMTSILPLINDHDWLFEQYINQQKSAVLIAQELNINSTTIYNYLHQMEIEVRTSYNNSCNSICWLEQIMKQEGIYIQHALNEGEYIIPGTRFRADGFCAETNTIYEFHGDYWHGNPNVYEADFYNKRLYRSMGDLYKKTLERENLIKSMGYNLVVMWEADFDGV